MFKKLLFTIVLSSLSFCAFAQEATTEQETEIEIVENPDEAGAAMPNVGILEHTPIVDVVEGVGTVRYANIAFREGPSTSHKLIRYSTRSEKVLIIGESGDWMKVRMYNNAEAYISKQYVRTEKIFSNERTTTNQMDKKASYEINDILNKFNGTLRESAYAERYKVVPSLTITDARKSKKRVTITLLYSSLDMAGNMVPSLKENSLAPEMRDLVCLIFSRLFLTKNEAYEIVVKAPTFSDNGTVTSTSKNYATISINTDKIDMSAVSDDMQNIWNFAETNIPKDTIFVTFP